MQHGLGTTKFFFSLLIFKPTPPPDLTVNEQQPTSKAMAKKTRSKSSKKCRKGHRYSKKHGCKVPCKSPKKRTSKGGCKKPKSRK